MKSLNQESIAAPRHSVIHGVGKSRMCGSGRTWVAAKGRNTEPLQTIRCERGAGFTARTGVRVWKAPRSVTTHDGDTLTLKNMATAALVRHGQ